MTSQHQITELSERYPFNDEELEILLRCHESVLDDKNEDSFLMKLAMCSPYSFFFLPGDELRDRVNFVEDYILPQGFPNELHAAIAADAFVNYANAGQEKSLERFLEGIADTGRRGPREAERVIYDLLDEPEPDELIDSCYRLAIASEIIVTSSFDKKVAMSRIDKLSEACMPLIHSLRAACGSHRLSKKIFSQWVEESAPLLSATLSTFVHNLLFHGHPYPTSRTPYIRPMLDHASDIFDTTVSPLLFPVSVTSYQFNGKWHRLYSSEMDGRSFNRLEWSVVGYGGPTLMIIQTEQDAVLGAFASSPWKPSSDFYGDSDCFLFQVQPVLSVYRPTGKDGHFMYCNSVDNNPFRTDGHAYGIGFGGTTEHPRLFIPETLEECSASSLDSTYQKGDLLPKEAMEKFQIKFLEVWGVGGDEVITQALRDRALHREVVDSAIEKVRRVTDKTQFVDDLKSELIPNKLYEHREQARGRHDFEVDEKHGGYKLDRSDSEGDEEELLASPELKSGSSLAGVM